MFLFLNNNKGFLMQLFSDISSNIQVFIFNKNTRIQKNTNKEIIKTIANVLNTTFSTDVFIEKLSNAKLGGFKMLGNLTYSSTFDKILSMLSVELNANPSEVSEHFKKSNFNSVRSNKFNASLVDISKVIAMAFLKNDKDVLNEMVARLKKMNPALSAVETKNISEKKAPNKESIPKDENIIDFGNRKGRKSDSNDPEFSKVSIYNKVLLTKNR